MHFLHRIRGLSVLAGRIESVPRNNKTNKDKTKQMRKAKQNMVISIKMSLCSGWPA